MNFEKLQDIANVIDSLHKTPQYSETGYSMVRCTDVKYGFLNLQGTLKVSKDIFDEFSRRYKPSLNDIVITRVGTYGITALVQDIEFCLGQNTSVIIAKNINPKYLYIVLNSPILKYQIEASVVGSTQKTLSLKAINSLEIPRFSPEIEDRIAKIISELDDKIYLNNQINRTLESIAQALFKSWFIDFEPVRAKIAAKQEGKDPELAAMCAISGKTQAELEQMAGEDFAELQAMAALFPDELIESELGEVPKGWEVSNFKGFCKKIESGGTPKRSELHYWNGEIRWLSSGEVRETVVLDTKEKITKTGLLNSSAKLWEKYTTVIAMYGATAGQVCLLANEMAANQACCGLIPKDEFKSFAFLIARNSVRSLSDKASGSAQQNLNKGIIENQPCVLPRLSVARNFENLVFPLLRKWLANSEENIRLSVIRDSLLPKLLSGEVSLDMV